MRKVSAIFETSIDANKAIADLNDAGFTSDALNEPDNDALLQKAHRIVSTKRHRELGAIIGIMIGGPLGTVLGLLLVSLIWGSATFGAGPATSALIFATGGAIGSLLGATAGYMLPSVLDNDKRKVHGARREGVVLTLNADEEGVPSVRDILLNRNAVSVDVQAASA